jgi:hypothetical protein
MPKHLYDIDMTRADLFTIEMDEHVYSILRTL